MKVLNDIVKLAKSIRIVKAREDEYTALYIVYYNSEKVGVIEVRSDYSTYIDKIKKFLELLS
ncbi:MAG: hypothetical protein QXJ97_10730 [Desulfurococcaceae archaeon]